MKFPCKACGECCRHVNGLDGLDRGDGVCRYFDEVARLCSIYESRPAICRVDTMYETRHSDHFSPKVYYMTQAMSCAILSKDNQDMVARTETALREAGLYNEADTVDDATMEKTMLLIYEKITPEDLAVMERTGSST